MAVNAAATAGVNAKASRRLTSASKRRPRRAVGEAAGEGEGRRRGRPEETLYLITVAYLGAQRVLAEAAAREDLASSPGVKPTPLLPELAQR